MFLASNVTEVAVTSGWNGSYGSMGPKEHVRHLALVMGAMPSPQWVPNGGWRWSFWAENPHVGRGVQWRLMAYVATNVAVISDWNGSYGSMGPFGHIKCLDLVMGGMTSAQWVQNDRLRGYFLAYNPHV